MMPSAPTLRTLERAFVLLAWAAFGLGAAAVLAMCALALLSEPPVSPEQFLSRLVVILIATLAPTVLFRLAAAICRRARNRLRLAEPTTMQTFRWFEDSTFGN